MTKLETLVVPVDIGEWLQSWELGQSGAYFTTIEKLYFYWESVVGSPVGDFISQNKKELIEVILGSRGYRDDKPLYGALVKGHELIDTGKVYWDYDKSNDIVLISELYSLPESFITEMSKSEWNELGINDSNADFVKVDDKP